MEGRGQAATQCGWSVVRVGQTERGRRSRQIEGRGRSSKAAWCSEPRLHRTHLHGTLGTVLLGLVPLLHLTGEKIDACLLVCLGLQLLAGWWQARICIYHADFIHNCGAGHPFHKQLLSICCLVNLMCVSTQADEMFQVGLLYRLRT